MVPKGLHDFDECDVIPLSKEEFLEKATIKAKNHKYQHFWFPPPDPISEIDFSNIKVNPEGMILWKDVRWSRGSYHYGLGGGTVRIRFESRGTGTALMATVKPDFSRLIIMVIFLGVFGTTAFQFEFQVFTALGIFACLFVGAAVFVAYKIAVREAFNDLSQYYKAYLSSVVKS